MEYIVIVNDNAIYSTTMTYKVEANSKEEAIEQVTIDNATQIDASKEFLDFEGDPIYTVYEGI